MVPNTKIPHSGWKSELRYFRRRGNDALRKLHFCSFKLKLPMMSHKVAMNIVFTKQNMWVVSEVTNDIQKMDTRCKDTKMSRNGRVT